MTYIELINNFWQKDIEHAFSDREIALYFYLLKTCNSIGWKNPFGVSNLMLMTKFRWGRRACNTAKKNLEKAGFINCYSGDGRGKVCQYELKGVPITTLSAHLSVHLTDTLSAQKRTTSLDIDKIKDNNYNERHIGFVIPSVNEIEAYCSKRANGIDAARFFDYYQSKGWSVGRRS